MTDDDDDLGTTRWFGSTWCAPVCDPRTHVATPVGTPCGYCPKVIREGDRGITVPHIGGEPLRVMGITAWHVACWLRSIGIS